MDCTKRMPEQMRRLRFHGEKMLLNAVGGEDGMARETEGGPWLVDTL